MKRLLLLTLAAFACAAPAQAAVDLSTYQRVGRYDVPASEASAVTYDADNDSLYVVGDEGTAVVQVDKTGHQLSAMTLAPGAFDDTEGITYVGGGKFVLVEERVRQVNLFTYVAGGTLTRADVQTVKLGTTIGNIGIEGVTSDPSTPGGLIGVKEKTPEGVFATTPNWALGTASNGSPTADNPTDLFDPSKLGLPDLSDVYAVSDGSLLFISQEGGRIVSADRSGTVLSSLSIVGDTDNPLSVPDQGDEGITMDGAGALYVVNEQGGGANKSQLWVYKPGAAPPTPSVTLSNQVTTLPATTSTSSRVKVADVSATSTSLSVTGPDAAVFEVDASGLYLKAGTVLNHPSYTVSVAIPGATSSPLTVMISAPAAPPSLAITEIAPWGSSASYGADWWEVTNTGTSAVTLTGYKMDDSSNALATAVALNGVASIAPGESVVFLEGDASKVALFRTAWALPASVQVGSYSGGGVGLSTDGDGVNLFDASGTRVAGVPFGAATTNVSFENLAGLTLSVAGRNGAYTLNGATGSPGTTRANAGATVSGSVPAQLALTVGPAAVFAPFIAGVAQDYTATTTANVISTAGDATLSVSDPGHLTNGAFALPSPLQVSLSKSTWDAPVSNDPVTITFAQHIAANDPLRTGAYGKTVTLTLSTTTP